MKSKGFTFRLHLLKNLSDQSKFFLASLKKKSEPPVRKFGEGGLRIKHGTSPGNIWLEGNVACRDSNRHRGLTLNDNHLQSCTT